jgi:hypothetical protein
MCRCHLPCRVVRVGELRRDVELWAAAVVRSAESLADPAEVRVELCRGVVFVAFCDSIPGLPEVCVLTFEKGRHKIVFGSKVAVEARLGDTRFFDDEVDAYRANASPVEEARGGIENPFSNGRVISSAAFACARIHVLDRIQTFS